MSTTFIEALPKSRTHEYRGIRWTPAECDGPPTAGTIEIVQGRRGAVYAFSLFATDWPGVAAMLEKADGSERYAVFVSTDGGEHRCDCPGFSYAAKARADRRHKGTVDPDAAACKHIDAALALIANDWIAVPQIA